MALLILLSLTLQDPDVDALIKQLEDESIEVREKAMAALVEAGDKAVEKLKARAAKAEGGLRALCDRLLEQIAVPKELRQAIPPLRKVTIEATDRPLKEVFADFQSQAGITLSLESVMDAPVTVQVKDAMPLEALAAICKAARCGWHFDSGDKYNRPAFGGPRGGDKPRIRILPGSYVEAPRAFTRHYAVEVTNLSLTKSTNFQAPNFHGQMQMRLSWLPGMEPDSAFLDVQSVTDEQGRSLLQQVQRDARRPEVYRGFGGSFNRGMTDQHVQFIHPEADAKSIASVKGVAILKFVVGEKLVSFENPEKAVGEKREHGGRTLELIDWKQENDSLNVKFKLSGLSPRDEFWSTQRMDGRHFRFKTEDGSAPVSQGWGGSGGGDTYTMDMRFGGVRSKIVSVDVVMETRLQEDRFEFELKDIPFPK